MKKLYKKILYAMFFIVWVFSYTQTNASLWDTFKNLFSGWSANTTSAPEVKCAWLPGCKWSSGSGSPEVFLKSFINDFIQIVAVLAVFALIFSGIMYILSAWDEEKATKAKKWILWSLAWVFIAFSSWGIVLFINNISF